MSRTGTAGAVHGEILWWDTRSTDVAPAVRLVFGRLVRLAAPVIRRYESDLYHDAVWLAQHMAGTSFTFFWSVDESGTCIGTDRAALHRARRYRVTVALDTCHATTVAIEAITLASLAGQAS